MSQENGNPLPYYFEQKALGNYAKALEIIEEWTLSEKDPVIIETNLFRIDELVNFPELIEKALIAYNRILSNEAVKNNPDLKARIGIFMNMLYLRQGRTQEASSAISNLGFIKQYKIIGHFKSADKNLNTYINPEDNKKNIFTEKIWFDASVDPTGKIDAKDFFHEVGNSVFFLKSMIAVPANSRYVFHLGKTGYTDIWIDGKKIFSNIKKHEFSFDQYRIEVSLSKGTHVLLIRTGDSYCGTKLALRLTDNSGNEISSHSNVEPCGNEIRTTYFQALEDALQNKPVPEQQFHIGYLYYASGLNSEEDKEAALFFSKIKDGEYVSFAKYYSGLLEKEDGKKKFYFIESLKALKRNAESLSEIVNLKLKNNFFYDAFSLIESMKEINPQSLLVNKLKALAFIARGWDHEAIKEASGLKETEIKSAGYEIEALIYFKNRQYKEALKAYFNLYKADMYNMSYLYNLIECFLKTGKYDDAERLLTQCAELYPNNVMLRLKHADLVEKIKGPETALPYLLSARKVSPYHKDVLFNMGLIYHKLNNDELSLQYLRAALQHDPKNIWLERYIELINESRKNAKRTHIFEKSQKAQSSLSLPAEDELKKKNNSAEKQPDNFLSLEKEIFNSYYSGNYDLFNKIEKLLLIFPIEPESIFYYRELAGLSKIYGCERTVQTLQKLINSVNKSNFLNQNLYLLFIKLELEKLLYRSNTDEAKKLSKEFFPVKKWLLFGPYLKYGNKDLDYPFLPEIITNFKRSNIKKKEINIEDPDGRLDFAKYLYPEKGTAYALTAISSDKPVKIRIYSSCSYKFFINGRETIKNLKGDIFRTCRIIKVWNATKITLMIKLFMKESVNDFRIIITDENDKIINVDADCSDFVFSDYNFVEEMDFPYGQFSGAALTERGIANDANYKLALYFHGLGSDEAIKFYRKACTAHKPDNPVKMFQFAKFLLEEGAGDKESYMYMKGMNIIENLSKEYPYFLPAREIKLKRLIEKNLYEAYNEAVKLFKNNNNADSFLLRLDYADLLFKSGYEKEFEEEIESLIKNCPNSIQPLRLLAEYYKNRNVAKSIEIYKTILVKENSEDTLKDLIGIYKEQGSYEDIKTLISQYDTGARFKKELIESLMNAGNFTEAKKAIFHELARKNDPVYNIRLGDISYHEGLDPAMYWQKALSISPSNYLLNDFLEYFEKGKIENPFKQYRDDSIDKEIQKKDIKDIKDKSPSILSLKKSMILLLNEDGGSRLFCEDVISFADAKAVNKSNQQREYRLLSGEIFPVSVRIHNNDGSFSDLFSINKTNGFNSILLPALKEGSIVHISYYINNPVINPKGSNFFTYTLPNDLNEALSDFMLKVIAPKDTKVRFSFDKEAGIKSEILSDKIVYTVLLNNFKKIKSEDSSNSAQNDKTFSFSTMNDMKDFILWYSGQTNGKFNIYDDTVTTLFAGKESSESIKLVYEYVSREIKLESNNLFNPKNAMNTLFNQRGAAEDKTILAASILAELGIKSYIAFTGKYDSYINASFISPEIFTNILLFVPLDVQTGIWMDFSDDHFKYGEVNKKLHGKDAVVIIKDGYEIKKISGNQTP